MSLYTLKCPTCGREYQTSHAERRAFCSVGCQVDAADTYGRNVALSELRRVERERDEFKAVGEAFIDEIKRLTVERDTERARLAFLGSEVFWQLERRHVGGGVWHSDEPERDVWRVGYQSPIRCATVDWTDDKASAVEAIDAALEALREAPRAEGETKR